MGTMKRRSIEGGSNAPSNKACSNVLAAIDINRAFPDNIFRIPWAAISFFDSDHIFDADFVGIAHTLLAIEGATSACLENLQALTADNAETAISFVIDKQTHEDTYSDFLNGTEAGQGWIHRMDRFGCTSDLGSWCIYCERPQEIAAIAIHKNCALEEYEPVLVKLHALPIDQAIARPLSYGFSPRALSQPWQEELVKNYLRSARG